MTGDLVARYYEYEAKMRGTRRTLEDYAREYFTKIETYRKAEDARLGIMLLPQMEIPFDYVPLGKTLVDQINTPITLMYKPKDEKDCGVVVNITLSGVDRFVPSPAVCMMIGIPDWEIVAYLNNVSIKVIFGKEKKLGFQFRYFITQEEIIKTIIEKNNI